MELLQVIDPSKLHEYSNIDVSKLDTYTTSKIVATLDYNNLIQFIDIFKDITQFFKDSAEITLGDIIVYVLYNTNSLYKFSKNQYMVIQLKLLQKGITPYYYPKLHTR